MQEALWLLDGASVAGLRELILALAGKVARRSGDLADGCQRAIVQVLRAADADHVLAVKGNRQSLHRKVKVAFDDAEQGVLKPTGADRCETVERNGSRRERRICTVLGGPSLCQRVADPEAWPGLHSLIQVQVERYYITSRSPDAAVLPGLVRGHWGVENRRHRTLDVQFREDDCRMRKGNAPAVMAALNLLRTIQRKLETDVSIGLLRDRIGRQPWILAAALP